MLMMHPRMILRFFRSIVCARCGHTQSKSIWIVRQAILPIADTDDVNLRVDFVCPKCREVRTAVSTARRSLVLASMERAIRAGRCRSLYREPFEVRLPEDTRPSTRSGMPDGPITDAELDRARRLLGRTSFKRRSKSWKRFLQRARQGK